MISNIELRDKINVLLESFVIMKNLTIASNRKSLELENLGECSWTITCNESWDEAMSYSYQLAKISLIHGKEEIEIEIDELTLGVDLNTENLRHLLQTKKHIVKYRDKTIGVYTFTVKDPEEMLEFINSIVGTQI